MPSSSLNASSGGTSGAYAYYTHHVYKQCSYVPISDVDGNATPNTLTVAANLSSARLVADFLLSDCTTMAVDETFTATTQQHHEVVPVVPPSQHLLQVQLRRPKPERSRHPHTLFDQGEIGTNKAGEFLIQHL